MLKSGQGTRGIDALQPLLAGSDGCWSMKNSLVIEDQQRAGTQNNRTAHVRQNGFESPQGNLRLSIEGANAIQIGGHRLTA